MLRYPELELVSVPAKAQYADPVRPLAVQQTSDDVLDLADVAGGRRVETRLMAALPFIRSERLRR